MPTLSFTNGNDVYTVSPAGTYDLSFLGGDDTLTVNGGTFTTAHMGLGNDRANLRSGAASIFGDAGNDRFDIYASDYTVDGGDGADQFLVRGGNSLRLTGGLGDDRFDFLANTGDFLAHGNDGNDRFYGGGRTISGTIYGDAGNDYFGGFANHDGNLIALYGGLGNDTYRVDAFTTPTFLELAGQGTDTVQLPRGQSFVLPDNIENLIVLNNVSGSTGFDATLAGNASNNSITGGSNAEVILGLGGNDRLSAGGAYDTLFGGDGNDTLIGAGYGTLYGDAGNDSLRGGGHDLLQGGAGNDTYFMDVSAQDDISESSPGGTDTIRITYAPIYTDWTMPANVENVIQTVSSTHFGLHGNALNNIIIGSSGYDDLYGGDGNDVISGGAGDAYDYIYGEAGSDRLTGGGGDDSFLYKSVSDSPVGNVGVWADFITDFNGALGAGGDQLNLSAIDAATGIPGDQEFHYSGTSGVGDPGDLWITTEADGYTHVWGDINGDFSPDFEIVLDGILHLDDIVW